jgi:hypothetical protein
MVFLSLSVENIEESTEFYTRTLNLFKLQAPNRIICNSGVDLILDLYRVDSDAHLSVFGQKSYVKSDFTVSYEDSELLLSGNLTENLFEFDLQNCIAGSFLRMKDPSGNKITIHHSKSGGIS